MVTTVFAKVNNFLRFQQFLCFVILNLHHVQKPAALFWRFLNCTFLTISSILLFRIFKFLLNQFVIFLFGSVSGVLEENVHVRLFQSFKLFN